MKCSDFLVVNQNGNPHGVRFECSRELGHEGEHWSDMQAEDSAGKISARFAWKKEHRLQVISGGGGNVTPIHTALEEKIRKVEETQDRILSALERIEKRTVVPPKEEA